MNTGYVAQNLANKLELNLTFLIKSGLENISTLFWSPRISVVPLPWELWERIHTTGGTVAFLTSVSECVNIPGPQQMGRQVDSILAAFLCKRGIKSILSRLEY